MSEEVQTPEQPAVEQTPEQPVEENVSWVNEDGSFNRDRFGDDLGTHSIFDKYTNVEEFVKGAINLNKLAGQKVDDWLGSDDEEVIKERLRLSGVPKTSAEYDYDLPESFMQLSEEHRTAMMGNIEEYKEFAHSLGISSDQFKQFVEHDLNKSLGVHFANIEAQKQAFEAEMDVLQKNWGNDLENNIARAENMAKMLGMQDIIPFLKENPLILEKFHDGARRIMSDDTIVEVSTQNTLATAKDQIAQLNSRMMEYNGSTTDAEYQRMVEEMGRLQRSLPRSNNEFGIIGI